MLQGQVVASYGRRYRVALPDHTEIDCVTRGKKTDIACGDQVNITRTATDEGVIESHQPRVSLLYRSDAYKSKLIAANVTQIIVVLATQPSFYEALLNRCLIAAEAAHIKPLIVLNKCDLSANEIAKARLAAYEALGYRVLYLSAKDDITPLLPYLEHQHSVLVGQSGMGKSTIINQLLPNQQVRTQAVSTVLDSGKHTTTATHLYQLNPDATLIDSPGLQEFGLSHLSLEEIELSFIEFRPFLGHCRFNNCKHMEEPDCAITNAVSTGQISAERMLFYRQIATEIQRSAQKIS